MATCPPEHFSFWQQLSRKKPNKTRWHYFSVGVPRSDDFAFANCTGVCHCRPQAVLGAPNPETRTFLVQTDPTWVKLYNLGSTKMYCPGWYTTASKQNGTDFTDVAGAFRCFKLKLNLKCISEANFDDLYSKFTLRSRFKPRDDLVTATSNLA